MRACAKDQDELERTFWHFHESHPVFRLSSTDFAMDLPMPAVIRVITEAIELCPGSAKWEEECQFLGVL